MESLLVKALNSQDNSTELRFMEKNTPMSWKLLLKESDCLCFDDIAVKIKEFSTSFRRENHKQSYLSMQTHIDKSGKTECV